VLVLPLSISQEREDLELVLIETGGLGIGITSIGLIPTSPRH